MPPTSILSRICNSKVLFLSPKNKTFANSSPWPYQCVSPLFYWRLLMSEPAKSEVHRSIFIDVGAASSFAPCRVSTATLTPRLDREESLLRIWNKTVKRVLGAQGICNQGRKSHAGLRKIPVGEDRRKVRGHDESRQVPSQPELRVYRLILLVRSFEVCDCVIGLEVPDAGRDLVDQIMIMRYQQHRALVPL
jgi:hypothetical protein